jgi:inorganic triphosphatase YgiF
MSIDAAPTDEARAGAADSPEAAGSQSGPTETELKFLLEPDMVDRLQSHPAFASKPKSSRLRSVYFDTPDRDLQRKGMALRVRRADGRFLQTLKAANGASVFSRGEWECEVEGEAPAAAALSETPAAEVLDRADGGLGPVFTTTFIRTSRLFEHDGGRIEVSLDEGEILAGDEREPILELELELKGGEPDALFVLARQLVRLAPIRLSLENKAERGHKLASGDAQQPRRGSAIRLDPATTAAEAFVIIGQNCLAQAAANAELLLSVQRPEALHQVRVGLRRLRAAFSIFKPFLAGPGLERAKAETQWFARELDPGRDLDVLITSTFRPAAAAVKTHDHGLAAFGEHLIKAQTRAYQQALAAIRSERFAALLLETAAWMEAGDWRGSENAVVAARRNTPVGEFAVRALDKLRRQIRRRGQGMERMDPASRHRLRIRIKKLRYGAEFFGSLFDDRAGRRRRFMVGLKTLQDGLGELNDINAARDKLGQEIARRSGELAYAAGRAVGRREGAERKLLKSALRAFEDFEGAKPFWA